ncbi:beta-propeller domain-containing protein [Sphingomonas sp. ZT3P38]|uniref:beta-propeller domain-containing protein n=1 Tax=Parasphingomonas zepuensis TaxID=3096161 RepID=UPI002FC94895
MGVRKGFWPGAILAAMAMLLPAAAAEAAPARRAPPARSLKPFASDAALRAFLQRVRASAAPMANAEPMAAPPPAPSAEAIVVTGAKAVDITNTQEAGVDEGGIVKQRGDILIVLRRGRLFTISIAGGRMAPVDRIDAFPPGVTGQGDWYDEMLLSGNRVIVIGYSYARGGTEINRFRIDDAGHLRFEDAYQLRSSDYYSASNYAARLIGDTLIFYTPLAIGRAGDPLAALPGMRRWSGRKDAPFRRIVRADQVYIPPTLQAGGAATIDTLHTLTSCNLATAELQCRAVGVLGAESRSFYVSPTAMYLWISDAWSQRARRRGARGFLYRLPLGKAAPSAIGVRGSPVDQFSFQERAGRLNVVVRADGGGDAMWSPLVSDGDVALARIPLDQIGTGSAELPLSAYRSLPFPNRGYWGFHNRFIDDALLYGQSSDEKKQQLVHVVPVAGGPIAALPLGQSVDRIDLLGRDGIVIGGTKDGGLGFATIDLTPGAAPKLGDRFVLPKASQAESRSQAFFFAPDPRSPDGADGMLGLPVGRSAGGKDMAAMLYLRRNARRLSAAGELAGSAAGGARDDGCTASCVDWYGAMRPIFTGGRIFALIGYELVEGARRGDGVAEIGRVDFARPPARR